MYVPCRLGHNDESLYRCRTSRESLGVSQRHTEAVGRNSTRLEAGRFMDEDKRGEPTRSPFGGARLESVQAPSSAEVATDA